ncbi:MAG: hypothetical protein ACLT1C_03560 [Weissella confusa]
MCAQIDAFEREGDKPLVKVLPNQDAMIAATSSQLAALMTQPKKQPQSLRRHWPTAEVAYDALA